MGSIRSPGRSGTYKYTKKGHNSGYDTHKSIVSPPTLQVDIGF